MSQPVGWNIPAQDPEQTYPNHQVTAAGSYSNYYTPDSESDSEQQPSASAAKYSSSTDPFADLPDPVPVPYGNKPSSYSQAAAASGTGQAPSGFSSSHQRGSHHASTSHGFSQKPSSYSYQSGGGYTQGQSSYGGHNATSHNSKNYTQNSSKYPSPSYQQPMSTPSLVTNIKDFDIFGTFDSLDPSDPSFKTILKYIRNSHGLKEGDVWVHNAYEISSGLWKSFVNSLKADTSGGPAGLLLWYKTTSGGIQRLAQQKDGCVAFYDRVCRAFPQNPNDLQAPLRHFLVLCAVSLGKIHKDRNGFHHWSKIGRTPDGFNSIKGEGKQQPNSKEGVLDGSFIVPCGTTREHRGHKTYDLDFNEYMVFKAKRIRIKYVVDLEIKPAKLGGRLQSPDSSGGNKGRH
ncbi:unnamed protein product [Orchesella dallaii]|uniref:NAD(+) ADP-ribosyltransferase n=1 Tax=Orchesella dallaii TaxID=48710 RepID=A0ABP1RUJ5_9HEXA